MALNIQFKHALAILTHAKKRGITLKEAQLTLGFKKDYVRKCKSRIEALNKAGEIPPKQYLVYRQMLDELTTSAYDRIPGLKPETVVKIQQQAKPVVTETPLFTIEDESGAFSEYVETILPVLRGTKTESARSEDTGRILSYKYNIPVPGRAYHLVGELSRYQMETIYTMYPYGTIQQMSREFPMIPLEDLRRITRAFGITKDTKFPPHVLEENSEKEVAEFTLKAKANSVVRKLDVYKTELLEKENRELLLELRKHKQTTAWAERIVDKYLARQANKDEIPTPIHIEFSAAAARKVGNKPTGVNTYTLFSDIHFGKLFESRRHIYGRGTDKTMLRERCLQIAQETANEAQLNGSKEVHMICNGDVFESIIPGGMRLSHEARMDLTSDEQFMWAIDVFEEMLAIVVASVHVDVKVILHGIGGNHDRLQQKRDEDKGRTATLMFYKVVEKICGIRYEGRGNVFIHNYVDDDGIIRFSADSEALSFIGHHGDALLSKRTATELTNLFKMGNSNNYTVLFQGHYHSQKGLSEGPNFIYLQLGSVCSGDEYSQNELGVGAQPSFLIGRQAGNKAYGFDYRKITLY